MKTKIVYCLISGSADYYYEQLLISLCSLRKHNPNVEVEVLCDNDTLNTFTSNRRGILEYNIHPNAVEVPSEWGKQERSRYIKTNLRKLTKGDYLFVDTDTVICSSLESIDAIPYAVAAVRDSHVARPMPAYSQRSHDTEKWIWREAKKAEIDATGLNHFNSGVMYVKDTEKAYELYSKWAEQYKSLLAHDVKIDQLPLMLANKAMNDIISPLDPTFNCQVCFKEGRDLIPNAHIIHYFPGQGKTILSSPWLLDPIKESGTINGQIQKIIDEPCSFFYQESMVVWGDDLRTTIVPMLKAYKEIPQVINCFISFLELYQKIKKHLKRLIYSTHQ